MICKVLQHSFLKAEIIQEKTRILYQFPEISMIELLEFSIN